MRPRISPDVTIALGVPVKHQGEGMTGEDVDDNFPDHEILTAIAEPRLAAGV
ncbi:MAG: hypothetical protein ACT4O2_11435 [Beijerinckiaceae bacterium]